MLESLLRPDCFTLLVTGNDWSGDARRRNRQAYFGAHFPRRFVQCPASATSVTPRPWRRPSGPRVQARSARRQHSRSSVCHDLSEYRPALFASTRSRRPDVGIELITRELGPGLGSLKTGDWVAPGSASRCDALKGQKLGRDCRVRYEQRDLLHVRWNKQEGWKFQRSR